MNKTVLNSPFDGEKPKKVTGFTDKKVKSKRKVNFLHLANQNFHNEFSHFPEANIKMVFLLS